MRQDLADEVLLPLLSAAICVFAAAWLAAWLC